MCSYFNSVLAGPINAMTETFHTPPSTDTSLWWLCQDKEASSHGFSTRQVLLGIPGLEVIFLGFFFTHALLRRGKEMKAE